MTVQLRRERDREVRRQAILDAAERVFFRNGPATTMDEIAAEAEVAKGTVYLYFRSKEDVYLTLLAKALDTLNARFAAAVETSTDPVQQIRAIGDEFIRFFVESPGYFRMMHELTYPFMHADASAEILQQVYRSSSDTWTLITRCLQTGIDSGVFRNDFSAFEMAVVLWTNTSGLLRIIDARRGSTLWQQRNEYSLSAMELRSLIDKVNSILMTSFSK